MEDICFTCQDNIANVSWHCRHRVCCRACHDRLVNLALVGGRVPKCPICRASITGNSDSTQIQALSVTVNDGTLWARDMRTDYPYGCLLFGTEQHIANADVLQVVREAMHAVQAHRLDSNALRSALRTRLTVAQMQLVYIELIKEENLHDVLILLDQKAYERVTVLRTVQTMVVHSIESTDNVALETRAVLGTIGDLSISFATGGLSSLSSFSFMADGVSNLIVFSIFSALEVYRWSKDPTVTTDMALVNIGEHAVGCVAGIAGSYGGIMAGASAGASAGAVFGSIVPGVGTAVGGVAGAILGMFFGGIVCDYTGRWVYRKILPKTEQAEITTEVQEEIRLTKRQVAEKAASKFGVHLDNHSFAEANTRFRRNLLANHPDKNPQASEEEKRILKEETRDILACWAIVREYYYDRGDIVSSDAEESYIHLSVLRVLDALTQQWKVTRTWFGNLGLGRDIEPSTERIETLTIYV